MSDQAAQATPAATQGALGGPVQPVPSSAEPVAPAAPAEPERDLDLEWVKKFNQLSKREKALMDERRKAKEAMDRIAAWEKKKAAAKENPLEFLQESGLSYDEITNYLLTNGQVSVEDRVKGLEASLAKERADREAEKKRQAEEADNQVHESFKQKVQSIITTNPDFEITAWHGQAGVDLVYSVIEEHFNKTGRMLPIEAAAKEAESYLVTEMQKLVKSSKKVSNFFPSATPPNSDTTPRAEKSVTSPPPGLTTLTHQAISSPAAPQPRMLSEEESKRAAAEFLRRELERRRQQ